SEANISDALASSLVPKYLGSLPRAPFEHNNTNAYRYISDGFSYTLSVYLRDDAGAYTYKYISNSNIFTEIR
ncbi:MAG TPA: hypothetical protein PLJ38_04995, partial [bacterium]|nr:hypothetical protein [bacterium]